MKRLLLFLLIFPIFDLLTAQVCGLPFDEIPLLEARLKANKEASKNSIEQRMETQFVPLTFHLTSRDDGTQRVAEDEVLDQLCSLNEDFAPLDIQFYIHRFNYINSTTLFDEHRQGQTQMESERDPTSINIFIFQEANSNNNIENGVTFGYFSPSRDWLVMRKDQINSRSIVLSHEVGHFFSLLHPYNGWDAEPWEEDVHGNPAPTFSPSGVRTEQQNGGNCDTAGDFLCDTAPDYFFAFGWDNCNYTGGARDPNNEFVDPDETLFMSNFMGRCEREDYRFSEQQRFAMEADLRRFQRAYLQNDFQPVAETIEARSTLLEPERGAVTDAFNLVSFSWTAVEGATQYLLEIDRIPTFGLQPLRLITDKTFVDVNTLMADTRYYWRVRAFNSYATCTNPSPPEVFTTGIEEVDTEGELLQNFIAFPNPSRTNTRLQFEVSTNRAFEARIQLFDSVGRLVYENPIALSSSNNRFDIDTERLAAGVYIARIVAGEERFEEKVVLLD